MNALVPLFHKIPGRISHFYISTQLSCRDDYINKHDLFRCIKFHLADVIKAMFCFFYSKGSDEPWITFPHFHFRHFIHIRCFHCVLSTTKEADVSHSSPSCNISRVYKSSCWKLFESRHDKSNKKSVRPTKTQISPGILSVWSESSLCSQRVAKDPRFLHADSEDSGQTGRMPRLIWVFARRRAILLVLSCRGSFEPANEEMVLIIGGQRRPSRACTSA